MPLDGPPTPPLSRSVWPWMVLVLALLLHGVLTIRLFPSWSALVDDRPVIMVDHAIHLAHGALGARFLREHGTTWGYDPFFMAGYPETPVWDSSSNLSIAFQTLAGGRYSPRAYKLGLFVCSLLAIAFLPAGALAAGLGRAEAALTAVLGVVIFWTSMPAMLWRTGLFSFVTASGALALVLGLLLRFDRRPTIGRWASLAASGAALLFIHITAPVLILGGGLGYLPGLWRKPKKHHIALVAAASLALAANAFWLIPFWRFHHIRKPTFYYLTADSILYLPYFYINSPVDGRISLVLLIFGVLGLAAWWWEGETLRALAFGGSIVVLWTLTAAGSLWPVTKTLEPLRFLMSVDFVLTIPAGSWLVRMASWVGRRAGGGARGAIAVGLFTSLTIGGGWLISPATFVHAARQLVNARPLVVGLRPADHALVRWLKSETDLSARVLFEDQLRLFERTDAESTHWTPLLPVLLAPEQRAFIGGIYVTAFIEHNQRASFGDYSLGGTRIDQWTTAQLEDYFATYNIGWVICWSPLSRFVFDNSPLAQPVTTLLRPATPGHEVMRDETQWRAIAAKAGPEVANRFLLEGVNRYKIYRVDRPYSYFLEGRGVLRSLDANRVELADVSPDPSTRSAILSLHWLDTWKSDPPLPLSPVSVGSDPVPFVRITLDRPLPRVVLYNGYGRK